MKKAFLATVAIPMALAMGGCSEMMERHKTPEERKADAIEVLNTEFGMNVKEITIPKAMYDLPAGSYEVTIKTANGEKDCIANVVKTTHHHTNVILNCP